MSGWKTVRKSHRSLSRTVGEQFVCVMVVLVGVLPAKAAAQELLRPIVELSAGWLGFPDDGGTVSEGMLGGTVRWYLSPRLSVGPEAIWVNGRDHSHFVLTGNVIFDLLSPGSGKPQSVTPFLLAGGGMFQTRETFSRGDYTSTEGAFTAGGGARVRATDRVTFGIESRIGWEPHLRVNGFVGVHF